MITLRTVVDEVVANTATLAAIPAPTFGEERRAALLMEWWRAKGLEPATDEVGNVRAQARPGEIPALMVCAHMDTVFSETIDHRVRHSGSHLLGPGVGDNSVAVAALSTLTDLLPERLNHQIWIVATTAEEGVGNLTGMKHVLASPPAEVGWVVALEGNYLGRVVTRGVGSVRWHVTLHGPGGHAWEEAARPSAVHELATAIVALEGLQETATSNRRTTINVGRIVGGEAINARARYAELEIDMRSDTAEGLVRLETEARRITEEARIRSSIAEIGRRPAGSIAEDHPLVQSAVAGLGEVGWEARFAAASTDANAAYAAGTPAVTIGITTGGDEHTEDEWIDTSNLGDGLQALAATIARMTGEQA